mgnify:CR=1 FL=1
MNDQQSSDIGFLRIENLSISFEQGSHKTDAVKNVSLSVNQGELLALVGESGSGKSVTAHAITKLLPEKITHYVSGSITFRKRIYYNFLTPNFGK